MIRTIRVRKLCAAELSSVDFSILELVVDVVVVVVEVELSVGVGESAISVLVSLISLYRAVKLWPQLFARKHLKV